MAIDSEILQCPTNFIPRPFPPPSLANVSVEFIIDQLHRLGAHYWDKPESADCTVVVPVLKHSGKQSHLVPQNVSLSPASMNTDLPPNIYDPAGLGRRVTEPSIPRASRLTMKLHIDYLVSQSKLFRDLFSGSSSVSPPPALPTPGTRASLPTIAIPSGRLPRLVPSLSKSPVVFLPLPDPTSFPHLVHYMYFGKTARLEECLNRKIIRWEGVVRNVEYLGMRTEIKIFLGRWYGNWMAPPRVRSHLRSPSVICDDDDDDFEENEESDFGDSASEDSVDSESEERAKHDARRIRGENGRKIGIKERGGHSDSECDEPQRGRTRTRKFGLIRGVARPSIGTHSV